MADEKARHMIPPAMLYGDYAHNTTLYYFRRCFNILFHVVLSYLIEGDDMEQKPLKQKISITLDENVIEQIKAMADYDDRSLSQYINLVLKDWLRNHSLDELL